MTAKKIKTKNTQQALVRVVKASTFEISVEDINSMTWRKDDEVSSIEEFIDQLKADKIDVYEYVEDFKIIDASIVAADVVAKAEAIRKQAALLTEQANAKLAEADRILAEADKIVSEAKA